MTCAIRRRRRRREEEREMRWNEDMANVHVQGGAASHTRERREERGGERERDDSI